MKFSIVVPNFNGSRYIGACLESIIAQRRDGIDLEIIVIDGASDDGSQEIIASYDRHLSFWSSEKDDGQSDALNRGFSRSSGDIMGWLCSDDLYLPGTLEQVKVFLNRSPEVDLVYGDILWVDINARPLQSQREIDFDFHIFMWVYNFIPQPSTFWRRDIWSKTSGIDTSLVCAMDRSLWLQFIREGAKVGHITEFLSAMRCYPAQKTQRLRVQSAIEDLRVREAFLGRHLSRAELFLRGSWHRMRRVTKRTMDRSYFRAFPNPNPIEAIMAPTTEK
jgi:glycosyltransferase involved in cell wall biosynthesis